MSGLIRQEVFLKKKRVVFLLAISTAIFTFFYESKNFSESQNRHEVTSQKISSIKKEEKKSKIKKQDLIVYEKELTDKGWQEEAISPSDLPDEDVTELSLEALKTKEQELQKHLQTGSFAASDLEKIYEIYNEATDHKTKKVSLEALGRSSDEASDLLIEKIFKNSKILAEKRSALNYIHSIDLLLSIVHDSNEEKAVKEQAFIAYLSAMHFSGRKIVLTEFSEDLQKIGEKFIKRF